MITRRQATEQLLYLQVAHRIERHIMRGTLTLGDKLPSIRAVCQEQGVSLSTALRAYDDLQRKGLITSRPRSGYYVTYAPERLPSLPAISSPIRDLGVATTEALVTRVFSELGTRNNTHMSLGVPAPELLPIAALNKAVTQAVRDTPAGGTSYDRIQGSLLLRREVAKSTVAWGGMLHEDDLVTTTGCMSALGYALRSVTKAGDTIITESPVYFGILQLARSLGLKVLELPTSATTGIDLDAVQHILRRRKIKACIVVSNFSNPLGCSIPDDHKRSLVRLMEHHNIPLIEDDLYGDLYFGQRRPTTCKRFDENGIVLWCSSVSKTLAPGYRVGWVAPGQFREKVIRTKLYDSISSPALMHEAVGIFLQTGRYNHHLRTLRQTLAINALQYLRAISEYFPENTRVSRPEGGFLLWLELPQQVDTARLYEAALSQKISFAPGRMFTLRNQYDNCLRLSYGIPWDSRIDKALRTLGTLAKRFLVRGVQVIVTVMGLAPGLT